MNNFAVLMMSVFLIACSSCHFIFFVEFDLNYYFCEAWYYLNVSNQGFHFLAATGDEVICGTLQIILFVCATDDNICLSAHSMVSHGECCFFYFFLLHCNGEWNCDNLAALMMSVYLIAAVIFFDER